MIKFSRTTGQTSVPLVKPVRAAVRSIFRPFVPTPPQKKETSCEQYLSEK
jgi:hypothetical protein